MARRAVDTIVEQGEGARGDWHEAHFGRLLPMLDEYLAVRAESPTFDPARPVCCRVSGRAESGEPVALITDPFSVRCTDLRNSVYELVLQVLAPYFAHSDETDQQLGILAWVAIEPMEDAVAPLGMLVTRLPVGEGHPGLHGRTELRALLRDGLSLAPSDCGVAAHGGAAQRGRGVRVDCKHGCPSAYAVELAEVADALAKQAARLNAAAH